MIRSLAKIANYLFGNVMRKNKVFVGCSLDYMERGTRIDNNYFDYIRLATLELASHEINTKKLKGNVAELGVYRGKFAKHINMYFPDRILYLFDTFEGFDQRDKKKEHDEKYSNGDQDFSKTSEQEVLKLMPRPDKCVIIKGYFPESLKGLEDKFVLISLDADLYEPIYQGLVYFYPRLVRGGYIFIHDFNNDFYKGARKAVEQFCEENSIGYIPLPDSSGSAIICK